VSDSYLTLASDADGEVEVKRSRFVCRVRRVETEDAARAVIESARREMAEARHHCSAFVLGPDAAVRRTNDDGEPGGTAGAPMLEVLTRRELSDVVAVVTRYFGGVLLGAGGLIRAYSDAVVAALQHTALVRREQQRVAVIDASHVDAGRLDNELRNRGFAVLSVEYAAQVTLRTAVPPEDADELVALVAGVTGGAGRTRIDGTTWVDLPVKSTDVCR